MANSEDKKAHDKLKSLCGDMQTTLDNIVLSRKDKNCAGIYIIIGFLQGVNESLDRV